MSYPLYLPSRILNNFICGLLIFVVMQSAAWADTAAEDFAKGVKAFHSQDYETALRFFEQARSQNFADHRLYYNLGVTYYKLGRYPEAERAFRKLVNDPKMAPLAKYNLGLVALKQDRKQQAAEWFRKSLALSASSRVGRLSAEQLGRLGYAVPTQGAEKSPGFAMVRGSLGYDDNVILQADVLSAATANKDDSFIELFAFGNKEIAQLGHNALQIEASLFDIRYAQLDAYNIDDLYLGAVLERNYDHWTLDTGLSQDLTFVGGKGLNRTATVQVAGMRNLAESRRLNLRYKLSRIDAVGTAYGYLAGWRHQIQVDSTLKVGRQRLKFSYRFEYNDRKDLQAPLFTSYSPTRHDLGVRSVFPMASRLKGSLELRYRYSHYHDASQQFDGSYITRSDKRYRLTAKAIYSLNKRSDLTAQYTYTDNLSNLAVEQYTRNRYSLNLSYLW